MAMGNLIRFEMPRLAELVQSGRAFLGGDAEQHDHDADTSRYKALLQRELDQPDMTSRERADAEANYRLREALYGGD